MDVVVRASQEGGGYWIRARGRGACAGISVNAMLIYSGFNYTSMLQEQQVCTLKEGKDILVFSS